MTKTYYNLLNDYLFKRICYEPRYLRQILKDLYNVDFKKVTYLNKELVVINKNQRVGIVDLLLKLDDTYVILELQVKNNYNFEERLLWYTVVFMYIHGLGKGDNYSKLKNFKTLAIINYPMKNDVMMNNVNLIKNSKYLFTDKIDIEIVNLTKYKDNEKDTLYKLFRFKTLDELNDIEKSTDNTIYKEIIDKLKYYNLNEKERLKMDKLAEIIRNEPGAKQIAYRKGKNKGKAIGLSQGKTIGILQEKNNIARNLLNKNVDINVIMDVTNLSKQQIMSLQ